MNIIAKIKQLGHGAVAITEWLGSGGEVVPQEVAQERANICLKCPKHNPDQNNLVLFGKAVRSILSAKNDIGLHVENEATLGTCGVCGCVMKLQVFEPSILVDASESYPENCWKNYQP